MKVMLGSSWQDDSGRWHKLDVTVEDEDIPSMTRAQLDSPEAVFKELLARAERYVVAGLVKFNGITAEEARERMRVISS